MEIIMIRVIAILLLLGTIFFWAGAFTPPYKQWSSEFKEYLEIIHQNPKSWIWINSAMAVGVILTMFGFEHWLNIRFSIMKQFLAV